MRYKYNINSISNNFIKKILDNFKYYLNINSDLDFIIDKVKVTKNSKKRYDEAFLLSKKYPKDPRAQLFLAQCMFHNWDNNWIDQMNNYATLRNEWIKTNGLNNINMEFIDKNMVTGSLGNYYAIQGLLEANFYKLRPKKNLYLLLPKNLKPRNKNLFEYFAPHVNIVSDKKQIYNLQKLNSFLKLPLGFFVPLSNKSAFLDWIPNLIQQEKKKLNKNESILKLSQSDLEKGKNILKKMGLPKESWHVTLHVREPGYRGEERNSSKENFRNADPKKYIKSIEAITELGGWVFRMGDSSMTKLPKMKNFIDYAHSEIKSDFMDVFLAATSKFCIGTSSGYYRIPKYFNVPVMLTNTTRYGEYFSLGEKDMFVPRVLKNKKTNTYINLEKAITPPLSMCSSPELYYMENNIGWTENESEELTLATKEMLKRTVMNTKSTESNEQMKFKLIAENTFQKKTKQQLKSFASISSNFIERHSELIN